MRIVWSPRALDRVTEIALSIARDDPAAADRWIVAIFTRAERVRDFSRSGRQVPEVGRPEIREVLHGSYRVIYRIESKRVSVLTVRHGRQLLRVDEILND
jgi:plasmid stabilization system protein ParE